MRVGEVIGERYEIVDRLGVGASGEVYRARDRFLASAEVAIKILFRSLTASEASVSRFRNEAAVTRELTHPGIVQVFDFGRTPEGSYYLVMELVEGGTLRALIEASPTGIEVEAALDIVTQLAVAMAVAHRFSIVHRDLKPENILIDRGGRVRISDFGVAFDAGRPAGVTATGDVMGTVDYMAPEQLAGGTADARSDVFALGLIACELITGRLPWGASENTDLLNRFSRRRLVVGDVGDAVPLAALNIIDRALEVDPRARLQDGEALSAELRILREHQGRGVLRDFLRSRIRVARLRRVLRKLGIASMTLVVFSLLLLGLDRERLVPTTVLMLFERATGISTAALTQLTGVNASYSEASMLRCAEEGNQTCMRALLIAGISPNIFDAEGNPLFNILSRQFPSFAYRSLLPRGGNINSVDRKGRTPTMILVTSRGAAGREIIALYLLQEPDLLMRDWRGRTVLWYAAALGRIDIWELFVSAFRSRYGDAVLEEELNRRDIDGTPLIHILVGVGFRSAPAGFLRRALSVVSGKVDLNATDADGVTPLLRVRHQPWSYVARGHSELVDAGADPERVTKGAKLPPLPSEPNPLFEREGWQFFLREREYLTAY